MKDMATKYIKSSKLTELMRVKDKGANVKIYVKQGRDEDHVEELLMFVSDKEDEQTIVMSLRGDIDLNKVALLTEKMNLPTGGNLEIQ
jgi:succinyl-CoA synthetase beta subunit